MSGTPGAAWLKRAALILAACGLAWRIATLGMAELLAGQPGQGPADALAWRPDHPQALRGLAAQLEGSDPGRAEDLLVRAYLADPTDGRALMRLAGLWRKKGQGERADKACELAERLSPADAQLRLQAARYWLAAGNPQKTLRNWDVAMRIDPSAAAPLFPALLDTAKSPVGLTLLSPLAAGPPPWWQPFFAYAAQNAAQVDTLRALYALRKAAGPPPGLAETNTYLARLAREGLWTEAYMAWINALRPEQQQALGYLYDGGFELAGFQGGFDWVAAGAASAQAAASHTQGATGKKALHITFRGRSLPSPVIEQTAFLLPGRYRFSGRVRPDALQAAEGLEWRLECASSGARLAVSERFLGSDTWRGFAVDFQVADDGCAGVKVGLRPAGYPADDRENRGEIWFDDLAIELVPGAGGAPAPGKAAPAVTKPPARSGAGSAANTPGTPRRAPKTAPPGGP